MKHPIFHPDEEARIGPYPHTGVLCGRECKIIRNLEPLCGEHRYLVETLDDHTRTRVLEVTLRKKWERSDWGMLRGIWQPKLEARHRGDDVTNVWRKVTKREAR